MNPLWALAVVIPGVAFLVWSALFKGDHHPHPEILVIDDNRCVLDIIRLGLEHEGYKTDCIAEAAKGVQFFREHHGELSAVLLDYSMPDVRGDKIFEQLRAINARVPVILITGYGNDGEEFQRLSAGMAGVLLKPFTVQRLVEVTGKVVVETAGHA